MLAKSKMDAPIPASSCDVTFHSCLRRSLPVLCALFLSLPFLGGCFDSRSEKVDDLTEARNAMINRDFLDAEKSFERYLRRCPNGTDRWEVWNSLVELTLSVRNDHKAAIELMETMLVEYANDMQKKRTISIRLAEQYRLVRASDRAITLWSSVAEDLQADPVDRAGACRKLSDIYLRRLEFELSKEALGYCLALELPDNIRGECLYALAQTYMGMDDLENAIKELRNTLALQNLNAPTRILTTFMLADTLEQAGNVQEAKALFTSIMDSYPNPKVIRQRLEGSKKAKGAPPAGTVRATFPPAR